MPRRPLIVISPDLESRPTRRGPLQHLLTLDRAYADRVRDEGGTPLVVPVELADDDVVAVMGAASGLLLSGGDFDVDPALFGEAPHEKLGTIKPARTQLELALLRAATARGLPVLGVCGGMQLMNVARGGTLFQDLPSQRATSTAHSQAQTKDLAGHGVVVAAGTLLARLCGAGPLGVNSTHHQGIKAVAPSLVASAHADDGLVEAIEDAASPFFVGVQWHPESMAQEAHRAIYRGLVAEASRHLPE